MEVAEARRLLVCTGRIAHDLRAERTKRAVFGRRDHHGRAALSVPEKELAEVLEEHADAREVMWVQEEPANMGALFLHPTAAPAILGDRKSRP
jgi:2-oxoglutarate dehydrogenase E1 component